MVIPLYIIRSDCRLKVHVPGPLVHCARKQISCAGNLSLRFEADVIAVDAAVSTFVDKAAEKDVL